MKMQTIFRQNFHEVVYTGGIGRGELHEMG